MTPDVDRLLNAIMAEPTPETYYVWNSAQQVWQRCTKATWALCRKFGFATATVYGDFADEEIA